MSNLRVGIAGLSRGMGYVRVFANRTDTDVVALCDARPAALDAAAQVCPQAARYREYERLIAHDLDIVVICTPAPQHTEQAVAALGAGRHVLSEIPAVWALEEADRLVQAVEAGGRAYMMAENMNYMGFMAGWRQLVESGALGRIFHVDGEYIHDCRSIMVDPDTGGKTWRASMPPIHYCTHETGPVLALLNDRCTTAVALHTGCNSAPELGAIDMETALFRLASGALFRLTCGFSVAREPSHHYFCFHGTKGCLETARPGTSDRNYLYTETIPNLTRMIELPLGWGHTRVPADLAVGGHAASEHLLVEDYLASVRSGARPPIDVYDALDMSLPGICAHLSAQAGGKPVEVPHYVRKQDEDGL